MRPSASLYTTTTKMRRAIQCLVQYLEETTIHGLRYLSVGRGLEKFVWFIVIAISFSIAGYLIQTTIQENENEPVLTNIETALAKEVPFPAITIRADTR